MKINEVLGIDVSKKTIDVFLYCQGIHSEFDNSTKGFRSLLKWLKKHKVDVDKLLICFEHTGLYSMSLSVFLNGQGLYFSIVGALEIKRSMGLVRGKNDKIDAERIAEYAYLRKQKLEPYKLPSQSILKLQKLLSLRERMVKQRAGYRASSKEFKSVLKQKDYQEMFAIQKKMIHYLNKQIKAVEQEILLLINSDQTMKKLYELITSIKGVGFVLASSLLVSTNCFTAFKDSRKFACYAGIAPFERQSGTSIRSRSKVSHLANKRIKSLLNMAAYSAIQADQEIKAYYQRRVAEGKSKMSTVNIVRNKIVHRIFAVVKRGTPYVPLYQYAA